MMNDDEIKRLADTVRALAVDPNPLTVPELRAFQARMGVPDEWLLLFVAAAVNLRHGPGETRTAMAALERAVR